MADEFARPRARPRALILITVGVLAASALANSARVTGRREWLALVPPFRDGQDGNMVDHLGGENLSIARALAGGRGFADPFREPTGPTAWMPPALPALQAALISTVGEPATVGCVVALQDLALIVAGWVATLAARGPGGRPLVAASIFVGLTWFHFSGCYQVTHDSWLLLLMMSLLIAGADRLRRRPPTARSAAAWGAFGGLSALAGPVLGLSWAAVTAASAPRARRARTLALSAALAALVASPWVARNYLAFGRFIPVKSNLAFEWHQSNVLEPDGVLRFETGATHPYRGPGRERARYKELGEVAYLEEYRARSVAGLAADPAGYLGRVAGRLLAATVVYYPFRDDEAGVPLWLAYVAHPLPFYGLVAMTLRARWRDDPLKLISAVAYLSYLIPYVMVAYYERYAIPLLGLQATFCYWGWEAVAGGGGPASTGPVARPSGRDRPARPDGPAGGARR